MKDEVTGEGQGERRNQSRGRIPLGKGQGRNQKRRRGTIERTEARIQGEKKRGADKRIAYNED